MLASSIAAHRSAWKALPHSQAPQARERTKGSNTMKFATKTIHAGQPSEPETGALVAPIFQTSTYEQEAPGQDKGFSYSRTNNPTRQRLEDGSGGARRSPIRGGFRFRTRGGKRDPAGVPSAGRRNHHPAGRLWRHLPHSEQGVSAIRDRDPADRYQRPESGGRTRSTRRRNWSGSRRRPIRGC